MRTASTTSITNKRLFLVWSAYVSANIFVTVDPKNNAGPQDLCTLTVRIDDAFNYTRIAFIQT